MEIISRDEARKKGLKRFFTGEPCTRNHTSERYTLGGNCAECSAEGSANYRKKYPEKAKLEAKRSRERLSERRRADNKRWRESNPELVRELKRKYVEESMEKVAASKARYYQENKERCLELSRRHRNANKDQYREMARKWREKNRDYVRLKNRMRKQKIKNAEGSHTVDDVKRILEMQKRKCAACYKKLEGENYHVDHIVPLALGGSNWARNLQILCPPCNMSKGAKAPEEFYTARGFLL